MCKMRTGIVAELHVVIVRALSMTDVDGLSWRHVATHVRHQQHELHPSCVIFIVCVFSGLCMNHMVYEPYPVIHHPTRSIVIA